MPQITGWIQRFSHNARNPQNKKVGLFLTIELELTEEYWTEITQMKHFSEEYSALLHGKPVQVNSVIRLFNPISRERKIILISGRLQKVYISYHKAHPVLLPTVSHLSNLIIKDCHEQTKHRAVPDSRASTSEKITFFQYNKY